MYVPLPRFLLRAPLLPCAALGRGARALLADPLGAEAIALASPALAAAKASARKARALDRYARRAAFRPTPHGLLAGVCVGTLGGETAIATGAPRAHRSPRWARVDALARSLLEDAAVRESVRIRLAPSALVGASIVRWLGPGSPFVQEHEADLDDTLAAVLDAGPTWTRWSDLTRTLGGVDADGYLLDLLDAGLLESELSPPLVGPPAAAYLAEKLEALGAGPEVREQVANLPADHAVLVHQPRREPTLSRAAVERAARQVPLLVRLQEALAPPISERFLQPTLADALDAATEIYGAGAFDLAALAAGDYGLELAPSPPGAGSEAEVAGGAASKGSPATVLAVLVQAVMDAVSSGREEAALDPVALERAIAASPELAAVPLPPTAELFLVAGRSLRGRPPGTGWLLGLHAPAGASLGRFAHALGAPLTEALGALADAERNARPAEEHVDVGFTPSPALADLCAHPPIRRRALAVGRGTGSDADLVPRALELVADPASPAALALRVRDDRPIVPAPLTRVRSATAPAGVARLLVGWSLQRQHAPWAFSPGPLSELPYLPRLSLDGFVIAPRTWRLPADRSPGALSAWRRRMAVPRQVQAGQGDELLPVDLQAKDAAEDLAALSHVHEIWPPLSDVVDRDGRRVEAVVMIVERPDDGASAAHAARAAAVRQAAPVPPPRASPPLEGWQTFKLFGAERHQDDLLSMDLLPAIEAALQEPEIDRWFFLRYVDGPGRRSHIRLRVHARGEPARFARRLSQALAPARARGAVATVETADYLVERGRYLPEEVDSIHAVFQLDSERVGQYLRAEAGAAPLPRLVFFARACDTLAAGLGLSRDAREALARDRRRAEETWAGAAEDDVARGEADAAFREAAPALRAALGVPPGAEADAFAVATRGLTPAARDRLLPVLLHLSAVRLFGADRDAERIGYTFWERALEGLRKREVRR